MAMHVITVSRDFEAYRRGQEYAVNETELRRLAQEKVLLSAQVETLQGQRGVETASLRRAGPKTRESQ